MQRNVYLYIDASELDETIDRLRRGLEPKKFEQLLYRTLKEVGNRAKTPIKREVQSEYEVTQSWVGKSLGKPQMSIIGGVQCLIPVNSVRGVIGGTFKASGGHRGKKGQKLKLRAHIVKGQRSTLPDRMEHQGGNPPFMIGGIAFTRKTRARRPIARVVGLGVPQMPINRAKPGVQKQIVDLMWKRLEHNYTQIFGG